MILHQHDESRKFIYQLSAHVWNLKPVASMHAVVSLARVNFMQYLSIDGS